MSYNELLIVLGSIGLCLFPIYIVIVLRVLRPRLGDAATGTAFLGPFAGIFFGLNFGWLELGGDAIFFAGVIGLCVGLGAGLHIANEGIWVRNVLVGVVGLIFILVIARTTVLTCMRVEPKLPVTCQFTKSRLLWSTVREFELRGARIEVSKTDDGTTTTLMLQTNDGEMRDIPTYLFTSEQSFASRINNFVKNSEEAPLTYQYSNRVLYYIVGGIFILASLYLALSNDKTQTNHLATIKALVDKVRKIFTKTGSAI